MIQILNLAVRAFTVMFRISFLRGILKVMIAALAGWITSFLLYMKDRKESRNSYKRVPKAIVSL